MRRAVLPVVLVLLCCTGSQAAARARAVPLRSVGIIGVPGAVEVIRPWAGGRPEAYVDGSSVLAHEGELTDTEAGRVAEARSWLAAGSIPGRTGEERSLATRALLDLRLLTSPDGATVAAAHGAWAHVWPRDAAFVAVAFASTGHPTEASAVLRWVANQQRADGTWPARSRADGSGPVSDGRPDQIDACGWFPWAVWNAAQEVARHDGAGPALAVERFFAPAVRAAAAAAARQLGSDGTPAASADYWEGRAHGSTLGTAAPLLAGLRAAARVAEDTGDPQARELAATAARRLAGAVQRRWVAPGATRGPDGRGGEDAAVVWLARPFAPSSPRIDARVRQVQRVLTAHNGGLRTGAGFSDTATAWTPATAGFALAAASRGDVATASALLAWLSGHTTVLGALPEKVDGLGRPASVAPLGWTDALVLLTLTALQRTLPVPPA